MKLSNVILASIFSYFPFSTLLYIILVITIPLRFSFAKAQFAIFGIKALSWALCIFNYG